MATAKERVVEATIIDRIPHPKIQYAFVEVQVKGTIDEFLAYRSELLEKHPLYAEAGPNVQVDRRTGGQRSVANAGDDVSAPVEVEVQATEADAAPTKAPVTPEPAKKSAADIARERILAKRSA